MTEQSKRDDPIVETHDLSLAAIEAIIADARCRQRAALRLHLLAMGQLLRQAFTVHHLRPHWPANRKAGVPGLP